MERLFAVTTAHGPSWDSARPVERQAAWEAHADFMNALEAEGFVLLGGTLDAAEGAGAAGRASGAAAEANALLVIRADDAEAVRWRLAADPWVKGGLLSVAAVRSWMLRLGEDFEALWVPARARAKAKESHGGAAEKPRKAKGARGARPRKAKVAAAKKPIKAKKSR